MAASLNAEAASAQGPANILLVDDNPARLLSYRAILAPLGENLVEANSGTEALRRIMESEFAVILLDVNMPDMDGFETASLIHQHPRFARTPIIFVSAVNVSELDRLQGYKLGAVDYVMVPIIPEILRSKVMVLAELYRKRAEQQSLNARLAQANEDLARANAALQAEKASEVHKLNESLSASNAELERINRSLQREILERSNVEDRLRQADRRKDVFLATLAHELRNPLAPIQSALNAARLAHPPAPGDEDLHGVIERQMRHLVRLVDDLLDVSRITRDRLELRLEAVELADVLAAAQETVQPILEAARQRLELSLPAGPLPLDADPHRLAQVFSNLLSNASKFSPEAGVLRLSATVDGGRVRVLVSDSGIGLDAEHLGGVFDLFAQVDTSLERARGGLGIGLTLARRLVELHGGQIGVHSEGLGRGAEFFVLLPLRSVLPAVSPPAQPAAPGASAKDAAARPLRVMVVDDNHDSADMLALSLRLMGHEVRAYYDPLQVVDAALEFLPDLAFMDVGMPVLNGFDLAGRLRAQRWPETGRPRLVALTGWGQEDDRRRSEAAGFDEHLVKPAELETIERVCRETAARLEAGVARA
jgi:signal transduction histidine kinase